MSLINRFQSSSSLGSNTDCNSEPTNCYNAIIKYLAHLGRRAKRKAWRWYKSYKKRRRKKAAAAVAEALRSGKSAPSARADKKSKLGPDGNPIADDPLTGIEISGQFADDEAEDDGGRGGEGEACLLSPPKLALGNGRRRRLGDWKPGQSSLKQQHTNAGLSDVVSMTASASPLSRKPSVRLAPKASPERSEIDTSQRSERVRQTVPTVSSPCPTSLVPQSVVEPSTIAPKLPVTHSSYGLSTLAHPAESIYGQRHYSAPTLILRQSPSPKLLSPPEAEAMAQPIMASAIPSTTRGRVTPPAVTADSVSDTSIGIDWTYDSWDEGVNTAAGVVVNQPQKPKVGKGRNGHHHGRHGHGRSKAKRDSDSDSDDSEFECFARSSCIITCCSRMQHWLKALVNNKLVN